MPAARALRAALTIASNRRASAMALFRAGNLIRTQGYERFRLLDQPSGLFNLPQRISVVGSAASLDHF
jgi:hypothetical protein